MKLASKVKKNKKGFTLIELIVVMIIIAILAAVLIPSMVKYIDEARNQSAVAEARAVYIAAELVLTKEYASSTTAISSPISYTTNTTPTALSLQEKINSYANITTMGSYSITVVNHKVTAVTYTKAGANQAVNFVPGQAATFVATPAP